jgi:hypothetical protein
MANAMTASGEQDVYAEFMFTTPREECAGRVDRGVRDDEAGGRDGDAGDEAVRP